MSQPPVIAATRAPDGSLTPILVPETKGPAGLSAWTPVLAIEVDGVNRYLRVTDWVLMPVGEKPAIGYIGTTGITTKANAPNLNAAKRVMFFSGVANSSGIATINYASAGFASPPVVIPIQATTAVLSGPTKSTVQGTPTATSATILVQQQAILTGIVSILAGATANVLVIEQ